MSKNTSKIVDGCVEKYEKYDPNSILGNLGRSIGNKISDLGKKVNSKNTTYGK